MNRTAFEIRPTAIPHQQTHGESVFPYVIAPATEDSAREEAIAWVCDNRKQLLDLASLHGAVLLRDFPFPDVDAFDQMIQALDIPNFPYRKSLSNAVRINRTERVFSANEAPPEVQIFFHHEMAQTPLYPEWIMFYCEIAPESGGATPICRSDVLYERLKHHCPDFIFACESRGLKYSNVMPAIDDPLSGMGRSWGSTLGVATREAAEQRLRDLNYTWEWLDDGALRATTPPLPAVMEVEPGRKTFFNQLIAAFSGWKDARNSPSGAIRHGDETPLDKRAVEQAIALADELTFDVPWKSGDAVIIDNRVVMHARRSFTGKRKVVASLANMQTHAFDLA